jgi:hypothetical protein
MVTTEEEALQRHLPQQGFAWRLFAAVITWGLLSFATAQNKDNASGCSANDFKTLALTTHDEQLREKLVTDWLAKYGLNCPSDQMSAIRNNLPSWLGTAMTNKISQTVESLSADKKYPAGTAPNATANTPVLRPDPEVLSTGNPMRNSNAGNSSSPTLPVIPPPFNTPSSFAPGAVPNPTPKEYALRQSEIAQCLPGELATWGDGPRDTQMLSPKMVFVYEHQGAPSIVSEDSMMAVLQESAASWDACGGSNKVVLAREFSPANGGMKITVQWNDKDTTGAIGVANITKKALSFSPEIVQRVIQINAGKNLPVKYLIDTLQMTASHEIGHFQGLSAHSKRCVDVLSYYTVGGQRCSVRDNSVVPTKFYEYRSTLPTACDIDRCLIANKK